MKLRAGMEATVEDMLALLDEMDGDADAEPELGASEISTVVTVRAANGQWMHLHGTQETWAKGERYDSELDTDVEEDDTLDAGELDDSDDEPSLGWPMDSRLGEPTLGLGSSAEREADDDREPSLGWCERGDFGPAYLTMAPGEDMEGERA